MNSGIDADSPVNGNDRLLTTLERLLSISATDLNAALDEAAQLIADALAADKVDAFLFESSKDTLIAHGTSDTPMGRKQKALGLDVMPVTNGGRAVEVFQTGQPFISGRVRQDPDELRGIRYGLGIDSEIIVPLVVGDVLRGVLLASSSQDEFFTERDLRFLEATSRWVGNIAHRAELVEQITTEAAEQGRQVAADELIMTLAHDLRNHLVPIKARVQMIARRAEREGRQRDIDDATSADTALDRLNRLISDLLDVARLDQGLFTINPTLSDLSSLCVEAAAIFSIPSVDIRLQVPPEVIVMVDPDRIRQALENLLSNSVRHSPPGVPVELTIEHDRSHRREWVVVRISDRGPGIPPELIPRLFHRFSPGPNSTGLGLGLYLARRIMEAHGGAVSVDDGASQGTTFVLRLPADVHLENTLHP